MMKINKTLREERENVMKLKGICPDNKIPPGLLT
jgi:serine/threonine-protein phosphatase 2B catalytic subunit